MMNDDSGLFFGLPGICSACNRRATNALDDDDDDELVNQCTVRTCLPKRHLTLQMTNMLPEHRWQNDP